MNERYLQITPGSKAAQSDLCPGDIILAINGDSTELMTHMEAQNRIKTCTQQLALIVTRYETMKHKKVKKQLNVVGLCGSWKTFLSFIGVLVRFVCKYEYVTF